MFVAKQNVRQIEQARECYSVGSVIPPGMRDIAASQKGNKCPSHHSGLCSERPLVTTCLELPIALPPFFVIHHTIWNHLVHLIVYMGVHHFSPWDVALWGQGFTLSYLPLSSQAWEQCMPCAPIFTNWCIFLEWPKQKVTEEHTLEITGAGGEATSFHWDWWDCWGLYTGFESDCE